MYEKELELAIRAAKTAGEFLGMRTEIHVDSTAGKDIKLSTDRESERRIIEMLRTGSSYPILSEECGRLGAEDPEGYLWIIDPLDGTVNYLKDITEMTCVSIALWKNDSPVLGVVYRYAMDELYYGIVGEGAFCNNSPISVSTAASVGQAVVAAGFPSYRDYGEESLTEFVRLVQRFKKVRLFGTAAIMGTFVAAGKVDAYMEDHIMLWDIAAAAAIVSAAGGVVSIRRLENNMCFCKFFANAALMEDFHAKGL